MESTWEPRDLPVLDAVVRYFDAHPAQPGPRVADIAKEIGFRGEDVDRALKALHPIYVRLQGALGHGSIGSSVRGVTDEAPRAVGQWPSPESDADRIVRGLVEAANREPYEAKRTNLRAAADSLGGFGRDLLINVIANVATKPIGS